MKPAFDPNVPNPYDFSGALSLAESYMVTPDKSFEGRQDLAQGTEPSDSLGWIKSLGKVPTEGNCVFCNGVTSRTIGTELRQHKGRLWYVIVRFECGACV